MKYFSPGSLFQFILFQTEQHTAALNVLDIGVTRDALPTCFLTLPVVSVY
jgi:hypothetical protein